MTKMLEYVDDMQARIAEVANTEQTLIRTLAETLSRVDAKLLNDVRDLTLEHEARRVVILAELQTLAARIGAFPEPREPLVALEDGGRNVGAEVLPPNPQPDVRTGEPRSGDWRQAVSNITDELDVHFGRRGSSH